MGSPVTLPRPGTKKPHLPPTVEGACCGRQTVALPAPSRRRTRRYSRHADLASRAVNAAGHPSPPLHRSTEIPPPMSHIARSRHTAWLVDHTVLPAPVAGDPQEPRRERPEWLVEGFLAGW